MADQDVQSIIAADPAQQAIKANAWDIFHNSTDINDFEQKISGLGLSKNTKAKLWDLRQANSDSSSVPNTPDVPKAPVSPSDMSYSDIVKQGLKTPLDVVNRVGEIGAKAVPEALGAFGQGLLGIPSTIVHAAHELLPTKNSPIPGGTFADETAKDLQDAYQLSKQGKWSEAAKKIPVVGGMYDYASNHSIPEDLGTAGAMYVGGKLINGVVGKLGEMPTPPTTILGSTPTVRSVIGVLKPENAVKAVKDYPDAMARLKAEDPTLGQPNPDFLAQLKDAIDGAMTENRHYYEGHVGPVKATGMTIPLNDIADSIVNSISPKLRLEDPAGAKALEAIADRYRTKTTLPDLENMLQETNAQVRAINKLAPGAASQAIRASETKAVLDAQAHAFRDTFYDSLNRYKVGDPVRAIQADYGKLLGFKLDAEQLYNRVLREGVDPNSGVMGTLGKVASSVGHPVRTAGRLIGQALQSGTDDVSTLQKAFRDFKGQAPAYPTPPVQAPAGRLQLSAPPPGPVGALNAPANAPAPQGPIPPGMGPSAAYPTNQKALPPATTRFHPGETYGPGGMGKVVSSEQLAPPVPPPPAVNMIKVQGPNGKAMYVTQDELYKMIAAQKGR